MLPYPVDRIGLSNISSVTFNGIGSSTMKQCESCRLGPGGRSWESISCGSSCKAYLGSFLLEDMLKWLFFARVKFYCIVNVVTRGTISTWNR